MNKIKMIASIGSSDEELISNIIINGIDVIKINASAFPEEKVCSMINNIRNINKKIDSNVGIMLSIGYPSMHLGKVQTGSSFKEGDKIRLYRTELVGNNTKASVDYEQFIEEVDIGNIILINHGNVKLKVFDKSNDYIICNVIKSGEIVSYADVSIKNNSKKYLNAKDKKDIDFAHKMNVDYLELPRVRNCDDVMSVTDILIAYHNNHINVISRIESEEAFEDIDGIIRASDGVIIDRNNLSMCFPLERIPGIQRIIIDKCRRNGKISIVTLDISLNSINLPSRIEVQDLSNAASDGIDSIMFTDVINTKQIYINTIANMEKIIEEIELGIDYVRLYEDASRDENIDVTGLIATNVSLTANKLGCKAIIIPTVTGYTARKISRFRPKCPIIAVSPVKETLTSLSISFGINTVLIDDLNSLDALIELSGNIIKSIMDVKKGDKVIITGGYPFKKTKNTNFMKIEEL